MRTATLLAVSLPLLLAQHGWAAVLSCRAATGGAPFAVSSVTDISAAAVSALGAERCDHVYRIDGSRYQLGGCNRRYVGPWSPVEGSPIGHNHGRLDLDCR